MAQSEDALVSDLRRSVAALQQELDDALSEKLAVVSYVSCLFTVSTTLRRVCYADQGMCACISACCIQDGGSAAARGK